MAEPPGAERGGSVAGLVHLEETDSTNLEAMRRVLAGASLPLWVMADRQTSGRGRAGRAWSTLPGNLAASCALSVVAPRSAVARLSLVAGISAIDAIRSEPGGDAIGGLVLKWPNDILVGDAKAGGILVESTNVAGGLVGVVGFGLNLASAPQIADRSTTSLGQHGLAAVTERLVAALDRALTRWLAVWDGDRGFAAVRQAWMQRAMAIGTPLRVTLPEGVILGGFAGIDAQGALLVRPHAGPVRAVSFGEVTLARGQSEFNAGKDPQE